MVLVNHAGTSPSTLAKFMSTAQTTVDLERLSSPCMENTHLCRTHRRFPLRHGASGLSILVSSGLRRLLAHLSGLVLMSCVLTAQLFHLLLGHSWLFTPADEVFLAEQVRLRAVKTDDKLLLRLHHSA